MAYQTYSMICFFPKLDTAENMLNDYFDRIDVELFFKTPKEYLQLLPLRKWTKQRIKGKVLCDVLSTICFLDVRRTTAPLQITMPRMLSNLSALECTLNTENNMLTISTPNRQNREIFESINTLLTGHMSVGDLEKLVFENKDYTVPSLSARPKGRPVGSKSKTVKVPLRITS